MSTCLVSIAVQVIMCTYLLALPPDALNSNSNENTQLYVSNIIYWHHNHNHIYMHINVSLMYECDVTMSGWKHSKKSYSLLLLLIWHWLYNCHLFVMKNIYPVNTHSNSGYGQRINNKCINTRHTGHHPLTISHPNSLFMIIIQFITIIIIQLYIMFALQC